MYRKCSTEISVQNQRKVTAGLLELMRETPYEDITVSSLCQCAGITRRIFYHLFSNKTDALYALIDHVILGIEGYRLDVPDETLRFSSTGGNRKLSSMPCARSWTPAV